MKGKVLVVDDDKSMVNMLKDVLEMEGYVVSTAFDGEQAIKHSQKQPDIILLDINLPKIDGIEVCERKNYGIESGRRRLYCKAVFDRRVTRSYRGSFTERNKNTRKNGVSI